jgi:hypothetical protein
MSPNFRTPQQRDQRFARVRRLTQAILIGSGVASGVLVGFVAANTKPVTTIPVIVPTTTTHSTTPTVKGTSGTTTYVPPVTAPVTTTTVCTTTPSGHVTCY